MPTWFAYLYCPRRWGGAGSVCSWLVRGASPECGGGSEYRRPACAARDAATTPPPPSGQVSSNPMEVLPLLTLYDLHGLGYVLLELVRLT